MTSNINSCIYSILANKESCPTLKSYIFFNCKINEFSSIFIEAYDRRGKICIGFDSTITTDNHSPIFQINSTSINNSSVHQNDVILFTTSKFKQIFIFSINRFIYLNGAASSINKGKSSNPTIASFTVYFESRDIVSRNHYFTRKSVLKRFINLYNCIFRFLVFSRDSKSSFYENEHFRNV